VEWWLQMKGSAGWHIKSEQSNSYNAIIVVFVGIIAQLIQSYE